MDNHFYDFGDGRGMVPARYHPNGGGRVAQTALVDDSVFLDRGCVVFGHAVIRGRVRILQHCRISGHDMPGLSTLIEDDVLISGRVIIEGHVLLRDRAEVRDSAKLSGGVALMHEARVVERAQVAGDVHLLDASQVRGDSVIISEAGLIVLKKREVINRDAVMRTSRDVDSAIARVAKRRRPKQRLIAPPETPKELAGNRPDLALVPAMNFIRTPVLPHRAAA